MTNDTSLEIVVPEDADSKSVDFYRPLTTDEARQLTDTIRSAVDVVWVLIARAHSGKAWQALGYGSWGEYVEAEYNMSRSRSYQLLDQARVISEIEAAVPEGTNISINEATARDLKGALEDILPEIKERTADLDPDSASAVLGEILEEQRERIREQREEEIEERVYDGPYTGNGERPAQVYDDVDDIDVTAIRRNVNAAHDIYSSLSALASLPDELADVVAIIPAERHTQINQNLEKAMENLRRFSELWEEKSEDLEDEDIY